MSPQLNPVLFGFLHSDFLLWCLIPVDFQATGFQYSNFISLLTIFHVFP